MSALLAPLQGRRRNIGLVALAVVGLALWPLATRSIETPLSPPAQPDTTAVAAAPAIPCQLANASYQPGQSSLVGKIGEALPGQVRIRVTDADGKPLAGVPVRFEIITKPKGADEATVTAIAQSGADGIAVADIQLGAKAGTYLIAARTEGMEGPMPNVSAMALGSGWWLFVIFGLVGGLGLFFYGMELGSGGLQKVAGTRMRKILGALTTNRFMGVLLGTIITAIVQSSTATTVMVVGFVSASLMTLVQAIGVIIGANIGTTFTVQIIAFQITDYALLMIGIGVLMTVATKRKMYIYLGEIIFGFGMIFYGMAIMSAAVAPLRAMPEVGSLLLSFAERPLLGILIAAAITAVMHSGATIGLVVVLAAEGLMDLPSAMPIILGANIGTTVTTLLVSLNASAEGKQTAGAHFLFNTLGAVIFLPILALFVGTMVDLTQWMGSDSVPRQIANAHMCFNTINALIFLPLLRPLAWLLQRALPGKTEEEVAAEAFAPKYLNNNLLETPDLALTAANEEIIRTSRIVDDMLRKAVQAFGPEGEKVRADLVERRKEVEILTSELQRYYIRLSQKNLGLYQSREKHGHVSIVDDLRQMAQFLGGDTVERATAMASEGTHFSEQGWRELLSYQSFAVEIHEGTLKAMDDRNPAVAKTTRKRKDEGEEIERKLRDAHMARLDAGLPESAATSAAHMDLLSGLRQMGRHDFRICRALEDFLSAPSRASKPTEPTEAGQMGEVRVADQTGVTA